jgi:hypothetical protein
MRQKKNIRHRKTAPKKRSAMRVTLGAKIIARSL